MVRQCDCATCANMSSGDYGPSTPRPTPPAAIPSMPLQAGPPAVTTASIHDLNLDLGESPVNTVDEQGNDEEVGGKVNREMHAEVAGEATENKEEDVKEQDKEEGKEELVGGARATNEEQDGTDGKEEAHEGTDWETVEEVDEEADTEVDEADKDEAKKDVHAKEVGGMHSGVKRSSIGRAE